MSIINQNGILNSIHDSLIPGSALIDGRTEQDWLRFLSEFAGLLNFYDQDNTLNGNWAPFLLKDPVFLMAAISGTDFAKLHSVYLRLCHKLEQLLLPPLTPEKDLSGSFNQLFDYLTGIFIKIRHWAGYMQRAAADYPLKNYVLQQIRMTFANALQALFLLRREFCYAAMLSGMKATDADQLSAFEGYEERIWKEGELKAPYWEILGLSHPIKVNTVSEIFKAVTNAGDRLFNFLKIIVKQAAAEFDRLSILKSSFPDTTLLRTFVNLLKIYQQQLNEIGSKHLSFYYKNILKQHQRPEMPDCAYIMATLAKKDVIYTLPSGTLFDAGIDAQQQPVIFESTEAVVLNPAAISTAYTLSRAAANELSVLQLQTIANPGVIQQDENGQILSWDTLGSHLDSPPIQQTLGFAIASPMLLLREGVRTIVMTLEYTGTVNEKMMKKATCLLSTAAAWWVVSGADIQPAEDSSVKSMVITMTLKDTDPAIESFLLNPDGIQSGWPMFKMVFAQVTTAEVQPPVLHQLKIDVTVSVMDNLQLYNDYGALTTKVAYPPFGPAPALGSNLVIGSQEIFSKPLTELKITLNWAVLPPDFSLYYKTYNLYINNELKVSKIPRIPWWKRIFCRKKKQEPTPEKEAAPYNNSCFTVDFQLLETQGWNAFDFQSTPAANSKLLFATDKGQLTAVSEYTSKEIPAEACNPELQNQPLKFTELSKSGFMKMELTGPVYGFGSAIYPDVVSAVTLYNSQILYNDANGICAEPAALPFTPKLKSCTAAYSASVQYVFDHTAPVQATDKDYPVTCFLYGPFGNYAVYDQLNLVPAQTYTIGDAATSVSGIPLYAAYRYDGFLYLAVDDLVPASNLNLYFELISKPIMLTDTVTPVTDPSQDIAYYYLSETGWSPLTVLSDGTHNLTCTGMTSVYIPADITMESNLMPKTSYWIAVVGKNSSAVAATVLLSTNGIKVQRSVQDTVVPAVQPELASVPRIAAGTITKTKDPVPQLGTITQPFPSFGGRAAEDEQRMNQRVSYRLKTKDRAVVSLDYEMLIYQEFSDIYYSNSFYNSTDQTTEVYVVKAIGSAAAPQAFLPMVSTEQIEQIRFFIQERTSAFSVVKVTNPVFQVISISAVITLLPGWEFSAVQQQVIAALQIYLSPWIKNVESVQVNIGQEITNVQVSSFIQTLPGVAAVAQVLFKTGLYTENFAVTENTALLKSVLPLQQSVLFVTDTTHQITLNPVGI